MATVGAALLFGSSRAHAQDTFGAKGAAAFGADRLFSIHSTHVSSDTDGGSVSQTFTGIGFAWNGPTQPSPYDVPRLGFDYFLFDHFSLGGSLAYASLSWEEPAGNGQSVSRSGSAFLLAPRVGYVWMFSGSVGFWLRGGLSYHSYAYSNLNADERGLGLSAEGTFVFAPTSHFAFTLGPSLDLDLFGSYDDGDGHSLDRLYRVIGVQVGLLGWL